jgi:hypothetical protein
MAAGREPTIDHYFHAYYDAALQQTPRLLPARTAEQLPFRGTCRVNFPTNEMVEKILYRSGNIPSKYMYFRHRLLIVRQPPLETEQWVVINDPDPLEKRLIIYAIQTGTPVLGTANISISETSSHEIAFLMRCVRGAGAESRIEVFLFETYDTSLSHFAGSVEWKKAIGLHFMKIFYDADYNPTPTLHLVESPAVSVVPMGINLQSEDHPVYGYCLMWSLIFLSYLRDIPVDLRTASLENFIDIYRHILTEIYEKNKLGIGRLRSRVYGTATAGRRKTLKNRVRPTHNVRRKTSRKSISSVRRRIRSGLKHRRRRV